MESNNDTSKPIDGGEIHSESNIFNSKSSNLMGIGGSSTWCALGPNTMERTASKKLFERYFYQLTDGCGDPHCSNEFCASSGKVKNLTPKQAAAQAFQLFAQEAKLCQPHTEGSTFGT